jgi:hypothetical protein
MTVSFKPIRGKYAPGIYRVKEFPGGIKARMEFLYDDYNREVDVALGCYRGRFSNNKVIKSEGTATGPGGLEVYTFAIETLLAAETELTRRYGTGILMWIGAANETLYRVYSSRLKRHGYAPFEEFNNSTYGTPYLTKEI